MSLADMGVPIAVLTTVEYLSLYLSAYLPTYLQMCACMYLALRFHSLHTNNYWPAEVRLRPITGALL